MSTKLYAAISSDMENYTDVYLVKAVSGEEAYKKLARALCLTESYERMKNKIHELKGDADIEYIYSCQNCDKGVPLADISPQHCKPDDEEW